MTKQSDVKRVPRTLDKKNASSSRKLRSPPPMLSKNWHTDSHEYKLREDAQRRKGLAHEYYSVERGRKRGRYSRSPLRLGDKFAQHGRDPGRHDRESPRHRHPLHPHLPSRDRRVIRRVRRTPPLENNRHSKGRLRPSFSPPMLRRRMSPPPMRQRPRMRSLERPRRLAERNSPYREERRQRLPDVRYRSKRDSLEERDKYHSSMKNARVLSSSAGKRNSDSGSRRQLGRSGSEMDRVAKTISEESEHRKKKVGEVKK